MAVWEAAGPGWAAVVVNENAGVFLDGCLRALVTCDRPPAEIVVVDNASSDDSLLELTGWPQVVVEASDRQLSFAALANRGIQATEAPLVVVLTPTVDVDRDFGSSFLDLFGRCPDLAAVAPRVRYAGTDQLCHAGGTISRPSLTLGYRGAGEPAAGPWDVPADVDFAPRMSLGLRRTAFDALGGFDARFTPLHYEDADLCWRLRRAGWRVRYEPALRAADIHRPGIDGDATQVVWLQRNRLRFALKHLSDEEWWGTFVPAEIDRLRVALQETTDPGWPIALGAEAIETLARAGLRSGRDVAGVLDSDPWLGTWTALAALRRTIEQAPEPRRGWLRRLLGRGREASDWERQLTSSLLGVLEAQDRLNRELTVLLLLALLDIGELRARRSSSPSGDASPPAGQP